MCHFGKSQEFVKTRCSNVAETFRLFGALFLWKPNFRPGGIFSKARQVESVQLDLATPNRGDATLKVWDLETRQALRTLEGHWDSALRLHCVTD